MEKYYFIVDLVVYSIIPTLVALYVTERVKGSVKNSFDKKLEDLKKEHSLEISKFQTELTLLKSKENFKFTKLHEKRLEVLQKTYEYINKYLMLLAFYLVPNDEKDNKINDSKLFNNEDFLKAHNEVFHYFNLNLIYFDKEIEELLRSYLTETFVLFSDYEKKRIKLMNADIKDSTLFENPDLVFSQIPEKILPIKKQIEIKFREILGE
jgi:hypothetical protein